jgi:hypothetical protein
LNIPELLTAKADAIPEPFMPDIHEEFDCGIRQPDTCGKLPFTGHQENYPGGNQGGQKTPGQRFYNTAAGCFHLVCPLTGRIHYQITQQLHVKIMQK